MIQTSGNASRPASSVAKRPPDGSRNDENPSGIADLIRTQQTGLRDTGAAFGVYVFPGTSDGDEIQMKCYSRHGWVRTPLEGQTAAVIRSIMLHRTSIHGESGAGNTCDRTAAGILSRKEDLIPVEIVVGEFGADVIYINAAAEALILYTVVVERAIRDGGRDAVVGP